MSSGVSADPRNRHLRTDVSRTDLKRRAIHSGAAMLGSQLAAAIVTLGSTVALARLLRPADFGVVAMALPVAVIGAVLRNFGLDVAIIQREELDHRRVSALFWLALKLNLALAGGLVAVAPVLGWFYAEPAVPGVTVVLAAGVLALGLGGQHEALLKRQMRFGVLSKVTLLAAVAGALAALALALLGAGYWALVAQMVVMNVVQSAGAWWCTDWRPASPAACAGSGDAISQGMIAYGRNLTLTRVLTIAGGYVDRILVGLIGGPVILGFYENGRRLPFFVVDKLYDACFSVAVAGFSRAEGDAVRYRAFAGKAVQLVVGFLLPCLAFLTIEAEPVTLFLLGDQWRPAVPYARLLATAAFGHGLLRMMHWFYLSRAETARQLHWNAFQTLLVCAAAALGAWRGGVQGVAIGFTAAACLLPVPAILYGLRHSPFSAADFGRAVVRPLILSVGAAAALLAIESAGLGPWRPSVHCVVAAVTYGLVYAIGWIVFLGGRTTVVQTIHLLWQAWREPAFKGPQPPRDPPG